MKELKNDFISAGTLNSQENTWKRKFNATIPDIRMEGERITLVVGNQSAYVDPIDEIVLTVILKFLFAPVWLIKQFYGKWKLAGMEDSYINAKLNSWVDIGLVWKETSVTGQYLRPTYLLFKLFGEEPEKFYSIPFNTLTHTISEEQVMLDVMSGSSKILKNHVTLPRISELGFPDDKTGTNVIVESDFRNPYLYSEKGLRELSETEHSINEAIKNGETVTPELINFNQFTLVKKIDNTGVIKKDYAFHIPDLVIPMLRNNGKPQSIAIEVELSNKRYSYEESMKRYKNNNKFGCVYWLCENPSIVESLRNAYVKSNGTGSCKMYLMEFTIPSPEF